MLKRLSLAVAAALIASLAWQSSAAAQADDGGMLLEMRGFAAMTSGQRVGGGQAADKLLAFGRNASGEVVVIEIRALVPGGELGDPPEGAIAIMRSRTTSSSKKGPPDLADLAFVRRTGMRTFILGEWSRPPAMFEIARDGEQVRWRKVGADAKAGPWQMLPADAAH
ncbi:MAG TPA: hypothetical protein VK472_00470 [Allosphingosinicella sp.]|nr:hypothetical protein [Allosphingosinicella sp.]